MIVCKKCLIKKEDNEFYPRNMVCKECTKKRVSEYQKSKKGKEVHRAANKKYSKSKKGKISSKTCSERHYKLKSSKKKLLARWAVQRAVKSGLLIRCKCSICGDNNVHGHHNDYDRQLDVIWLCPFHHKQWHAKNGEGKNGN